MNISHEEFITVFKEKDRCDMMKYNLVSGNKDKKQETRKLSSI